MKDVTRILSQIDAGEPKLSGWTVYLDANNNGKLDVGEKSFTTGADGKFSFVVAAGTYHAAVIHKMGYGVFVPLAGEYSLTLGKGQSATGKNFAAGMEDGSIVLFETEGPKETKTFKAHEAAVYDVAFSPDGATLATCSTDKLAKLWDWKAEMPMDCVETAEMVG